MRGLWCRKCRQLLVRAETVGARALEGSMAQSRRTAAGWIATLALLPAGLALAGCDMATEIAGDTLEAELRRGVVLQCEQFAEGAGIAAGRISAVCQCSADTLVADGNPTLGDISPERLRGIVEACVARTDPDGVGQ